MESAKLLCWNLAGKVRRLPEQAHRVAEAGADLVCLQEVRPSTAEAWTVALAQTGLVCVATADPQWASDRRPLITLTAGRDRLRPEAVPAVPWPERVLAVTVNGLLVVNVHSPISPKPDLAKVRTHEAVSTFLRARPGPAVCCGDLNTPRKEHPDGRVWTFARDRSGKLRSDRGERWDQAELSVIRGLADAGYRDAFRDLYGPEAQELSWEWVRWPGGYRLDHLIASEEVAVSSFEYCHRWRLEGLSDHSPLLAELAWMPP